MGILALGLVLRLLAIVSWWPVTPTLDDGYQRFASNPFLDPQHPAGYGLIVAALGHLSRRVAFTVGLQHVIGLVSAVVLWRAARRVCVSRWAALLVLALMTLDPDLIFLEHSIMSESWAVLTIVLALYATVRCCERPGGRSGWLWALGSGTALAAGVMIRSATLPLVPVIAIAVLCWEPGAWRAWRTNVRAAALLVATVVVLLLGFASANAAFGQRFGIAPSPGWYLYGRVAQFADCSRFDPPAGTRALCQTTAPEQRPSAYVYEFGAGSPAIRRFGAFGSHDALVGAWAKRALAAQPGDALQTAWSYLRAYWVPSTLPARLRATSDGLDPQLQFTYANPYFVDAIHRDLARFYAPFSVHPLAPRAGDPGGVRARHQVRRDDAVRLHRAARARGDRRHPPSPSGLVAVRCRRSVTDHRVGGDRYLLGSLHGPDGSADDRCRRDLARRVGARKLAAGARAADVGGSRHDRGRPARRPVGTERPPCGNRIRA